MTDSYGIPATIQQTAKNTRLPVFPQQLSAYLLIVLNEGLPSAFVFEVMAVLQGENQ